MNIVTPVDDYDGAGVYLIVLELALLIDGALWMAKAKWSVLGVQPLLK